MDWNKFKNIKKTIADYVEKNEKTIPSYSEPKEIEKEINRYKIKPSYSEFIQEIDEVEKELNLCKKIYDEILIKYEVPNDAKIVKGGGFLNIYIWLKDETLFLCHYADTQKPFERLIKLKKAVNNSGYVCEQTELSSLQFTIKRFLEADYYKQYYSIPKSNIEYFTLQGEILKESKIVGGGTNLSVSGGGGGGSSIGGAIVGGLLAGGVGAIIGSRKKTEEMKINLDVDPIRTETVIHDERQTVLVYKETNNLKKMLFRLEGYDILKQLIPVKERKTLECVEEDIEKNNLPNLLRELANLKNEGIITEEEFIASKAKFLGL